MRIVKGVGQAEREREAVEKLYISGINQSSITTNIPIDEFEKQFDAFQEIRICPYCQKNTYYTKGYTSKLNFLGIRMDLQFEANCNSCGSIYLSEPFSTCVFPGLACFYICSLITILFFLSTKYLGLDPGWIILVLFVDFIGLLVGSALLAVTYEEYKEHKLRCKNLMGNKLFDSLWEQCSQDKALSKIRHNMISAHMDGIYNRQEYITKSYIEYLRNTRN